MTIKQLLKEEEVERARIGISFLSLKDEVSLRLKKTNLQIGNFDYKNAIRNTKINKIK